MKVIIKQFLTVLISYGSLFTLTMLLFEFILGFEITLEHTLIRFIIGGGGFSFFMVAYHLYMLKKHGIKEMSNENVRVQHSGIFKSQLNKIELIHKLKNDEHFSKMSLMESKNSIAFISGRTRYSWGQKVTIEPVLFDGTEFSYKINCRPRYKVNMIDCGENLYNYLRLEQAFLR